MPQCTNRTRAEQLLVCEAGKDGVPLLLAEITPMPFQSEAVGTNVTLQLPNLSSQNQRSSPDCHYWRSASSDFDGFRWRPGLGRLGQVVVTGGGGPDLGPQLDSHLNPQILNS